MFKIKDLNWIEGENGLITTMTPFNTQVVIDKDNKKNKYFIVFHSSIDIKIDEYFDTLIEAQNMAYNYIMKEMLDWVERI